MSMSKFDPKNTIVGLTADSINGAFYLQGNLIKTLNEGFIDVLKQIEGIK